MFLKRPMKRTGSRVMVPLRDSRVSHDDQNDPLPPPEFFGQVYSLLLQCTCSISIFIISAAQAAGTALIDNRIFGISNQIGAAARYEPLQNLIPI
jgi:hypothetical protein